MQYMRYIVSIALTIIISIVATPLLMNRPIPEFEDLQTVEAEYVGCEIAVDEERSDKVIFEGIDIELSDGQVYRYDDSAVETYEYGSEFAKMMQPGADVALRYFKNERRDYLKVFEMIVDGQEIISFEDVHAQMEKDRREVAVFVGIVLPMMMLIVCVGAFIFEKIEEKRKRRETADENAASNQKKQ